MDADAQCQSLCGNLRQRRASMLHLAGGQNGGISGIEEKHPAVFQTMVDLAATGIADLTRRQHAVLSTTL